MTANDLMSLKITFAVWNLSSNTYIKVTILSKLIYRSYCSYCRPILSEYSYRIRGHIASAIRMSSKVKLLPAGTSYPKLWGKNLSPQHDHRRATVVGSLLTSLGDGRWTWPSVVSSRRKTVACLLHSVCMQLCIYSVKPRSHRTNWTGLDKTGQDPGAPYRRASRGSLSGSWDLSSLWGMLTEHGWISLYKISLTSRIRIIL